VSLTGIRQHASYLADKCSSWSVIVCFVLICLVSLDAATGVIGAQRPIFHLNISEKTHCVSSLLTEIQLMVTVVSSFDLNFYSVKLLFLLSSLR